MRISKKYQIYIKIRNFLKKIPYPKLLKFKRPKWHKIQILIKKELGKKKNFNQKHNKKKTLRKSQITEHYSNLTFKLRYKFWEKIKSFYKEGLQIKNTIWAFFDSGLSIKFFKKQIRLKDNFATKKNFVLSCLIKPLMRVDFLLWRFKFFKSCYEIQQCIFNSKVMINNKIITKNVYLNF